MDDHTTLSRRSFVKSAALTGAATLLSPAVRAASSLGGTQDLNVALIGAGVQGRTLLHACMDIPNLHFKAVCDIWPYSQGYASRFLKRYDHAVTAYEDFRELLAEQTDLDAVLIASPDSWHAPHTIACLEAGVHVYCEKLMSNDLGQAAQMVLASQTHGKLLQIGHQRRSNPRYLHARDKVILEAGMLGTLTHANAHWHRAKRDPIGWPSRYEMSDTLLQKYGFETMHQFRNWRWYKAYGGGPISDLGAHQIDVLNWFFGANPRAVMASGGIDFHVDYEMNDNVMALFEYPTPEGGTARAHYQVITTNSAFGYLERFMGTQGAMSLSENPYWNDLFREDRAPDWAPFIEQGLIKSKRAPAGTPEVGALLDARETLPPEVWKMNCALEKPLHQPHLENFFDGIRKQTPLTCPGETGFATAVTVKKVDEAISAARRLPFRDQDFIASSDSFDR